MSVAFTTLSSGDNAQSLAMANELILAYSERRQALGETAISALVAGDNAQDKTLWLEMQNWLETNCTSFIDHINGPLNSGETNFLYFTKATWQAAAGLNISEVDGESFRRIPEGVEWDGETAPETYGHIAAGDIRGPWCFEDLQKGFGALKKTWALPTSCALKYKQGYSSMVATWALAKSGAETSWLAASLTDAPIGYTGIVFIDATGGAYSIPNSAYRTHITTWYVKPTISGIDNFIKRSAKIYVLTSPYHEPTPTITSEAIFDDNGFPEMQESKFSFCSIASLTDAPDLVGDDWYGQPVDVIPEWCSEPLTSENETYHTRGFSSYPNYNEINAVNCGVEITWDFTNA